MKGVNEKSLWTLSEVADHLGVSQKTISRVIKKGKLPFVQIGRSIRVQKDDVFVFVDNHKSYNLECVESVQSSQGESTCDSINVAGFTTLRTNRQLENRLENLLTPTTNK